jgi:anti-sigma factor RsiW
MHPGHPSVERLADLAEGLLGALARSRLEQHVARCARCSAELDRLTSATGDCLPPHDVQAMPDSVVARVRRIFRRGSSHAPPEPRPVERLTGMLRFDSATMPPAFGVRGSGETTQRQLVFAAGPFELELETSPARTGWQIRGQLLGPTDATSGEIRLVGPNGSARSQLTEMLEFNLPALPAGSYRLELQFGSNSRVEIESLELGT